VIIIVCYRGQNVSVLHLRGPPEPWEAAVAGSLRSARGSPPGQRELSPVRWCGPSEAGVYLGRSGWVQVQQHSVEDERRAYKSNKLTTLVTENRSRRGEPRMRLVDCHSASEPSRRRPESLTLPRGNAHPTYPIHTPSPYHPPYDPSSPPPITPIISPPPAFQDLEPHRQKPPHLLRSTITVDAESPPESPAMRFKHRTPSPHSPKHRESTNFRKHRYGSPSSSDDDNVFRATPLRRVSPRAHSTDSSSSDPGKWGGRVRRSRSLQLPEDRPPPARQRRQLPSKFINQ